MYKLSQGARELCQSFKLSFVTKIHTVYVTLDNIQYSSYTYGTYDQNHKLILNSALTGSDGPFKVLAKDTQPKGSNVP